MPEIEIPEIRAIAPPLPPDTSWPLYIWVLIALGALALIAIAALVIFKLTQRTNPADQYDPREAALNKLHELKENYVGLPAPEFALQASFGLREYLTGFYGNATPYETGREFLHRQDEQQLMNDSKYSAVRDLYERAENLKFAPSPGADGERLDLVQDMITFVRDDVPGIQINPSIPASDANSVPA